MPRAIIPTALGSALLCLSSAFSPAIAAGTPSPKDAQVYFIWPQDGTVIHGGKFWLRMGLRNMGVCPKGVELPNVGHHHLLIDTELPPMTVQREDNWLARTVPRHFQIGHCCTDRLGKCGYAFHLTALDPRAERQLNGSTLP